LAEVLTIPFHANFCYDYIAKLKRRNRFDFTYYNSVLIILFVSNQQNDICALRIPGDTGREAAENI
jgi:hypothetical protein